MFKQVRRAYLVLLVGSIPLWLPHGAQAQTAIPPTIAGIRFAPTSIAAGGTSALTISFGNTNNVAATLTQTLVNSLPIGMTVANAAASGTCSTNSVGAAAGSTSITYAAGATIPAGGCSFSVNVKALSSTTKTVYTDTIPAGALQTNLGSNPAPASGQLTALAAVAVPNVVGLLQTAAVTALQAAGLVVGTVTTAAGPPKLYNEVFTQTPAAGTSVAAGTTVALVISLGNATNPNAPLTSAGNNFTPGQASLAAALERLCATLQAQAPTTTARQNLLANCLAVIATHGGGNDPAGLANTLNAMSGMQTAGQQTIGTNFGTTQFANISSRLSQIRQSASGTRSVDVNMDSDRAGLGQLLAMLGDSLGIKKLLGGGSGDEDDSDRGAPGRLGFFLNGTLRRGNQDTTLNQTGFDYRSTGVVAGADYRLTDSIVLGAALGHSNSNAHFANDTARLDTNTNTGSLYASYYNRAFFVDLIGTYSHIKYSEQRTTTYTIDPTVVTALPVNCSSAGDCVDDTTGSTTGRQLAFAVSSGYNLYHRGLAFGPNLAVSYTHLNVSGFNENDPTQSGLGLAYDSQVGESLLLKVGGHASYAISTPIVVIVPQLRLNYAREFKNDERALKVHFLADPTSDSSTGPVSSFLVFTDQPQRNFFEYATDVTLQFPYGISGYVEYLGVANDGFIHSHELSAGLRIQTHIN